MPRFTTSPTEAAEALLADNLVALPTETVYGLGGFARSTVAVARIFSAKGRPPSHPVIVHISDADAMAHWARDIPAPALTLARAFWPGPLTVVVPRADWVSDAITGGQSTIALRAPNHPLFQEVLTELADQTKTAPGIAAPSANRFGKVSPTTAAHVATDLGPHLEPSDLILDGGACDVGVESTIVICVEHGVHIARAGGISTEQISEFVPVFDREAALNPRVPGALVSHYAPAAAVSVVRTSAQFQRERQRHLLGADVGVLGLAEDLESCPANWLRLASPTTVDEYAHQLYSSLRRADEIGLAAVIAIAPPNIGLGAAIIDRLDRASSGSAGR